MADKPANTAADEDNEQETVQTEAGAAEVLSETDASVQQDDLDMEMPFDDPKTDTLVDDIVAKEGDEILAHMDSSADGSTLAAKKPKRSFWRHKVVWYILVFLVMAGAATAAGMPKSRYWILNALSVRASTAVTVTDELTHQPLKNVTVELAGVSGRTDAHGKAKLELLKLGPSQLKITKPGFAAYQQSMIVGWGSNPLGTIGLKAVGLQYTFVIKDMLTGNTIAGAEVTGGDASALSDKNGKAVLTLPGTSPADLTAQVGAAGYRTDDVVVKGTTEQAIPVSLVTARKSVYVSKQSGKYDVYSSDIDGQNKQVILPGSGLENANISVVVSPDGSHAAVVSTRDDQRDADGYLLNTLSIVTVANGDNVIVAHADQIRLVDWLGSRLVFEQVSNNANTSPTARYALISYDYAANTRLQLATASKFSTVDAAAGKLYYAVSPAEGDTTSKAGLYRIDADGNGKQTILDKDVWTIYRTDYNTLAAQLSDGWVAVNIATDATTPISAPSAYVSRVYVDSPDNAGKSLWIDIRDGQAVLLRYDKQTAKDNPVLTQNGVAYPVRWLTADTAIFRVVTGSETADYAVSALGGGTAHKIADVTNTYGFTAGQ